MAQVTYTLGGVSFDAVPEILEDTNDLVISSESTIARTTIFSVGVSHEKIVLKGRYMTSATRTSILNLQAQCELNGTTYVLDDSYAQKNVLIGRFETVPIVGKTDGFSFEIGLIETG